MNLRQKTLFQVFWLTSVYPKYPLNWQGQFGDGKKKRLVFRLFTSSTQLQSRSFHLTFIGREWFWNQCSKWKWKEVVVEQCLREQYRNWSKILPDSIPLPLQSPSSTKFRQWWQLSTTTDNVDIIGWIKKKCAARTAGTSVIFFDVVCQTTTFEISDDSVSPL